MAAKSLLCSGVETGSTVYAIVRRESDSYLLDDSDGSFAAAPADPYVALTEDATIKGLYAKSESRLAWNDGLYTVYFYRQIGASPAPATDGQPVASGSMTVVSDAEADELESAVATIQNTLDELDFATNVDTATVIKLIRQVLHDTTELRNQRRLPHARHS